MVKELLNAGLEIGLVPTLRDLRILREHTLSVERYLGTKFKNVFKLLLTCSISESIKCWAMRLDCIKSLIKRSMCEEEMSRSLSRIYRQS